MRRSALIVLVMFAFGPICAGFAMAQEPPTPTGQSICDMPSMVGTSDYNRYCTGGGGSNPAPAGPTAEQVKQQQDAQDLDEAAQDAWDKGVRAYKTGDYARAVKYFEEGLTYAPDDPGLQHNLSVARQALANETSANAQTVQVDTIELERLEALKRGLQQQLVILDRVRAQQKSSSDEMIRFREYLLQDSVTDAIGLAANTAFLQSMGLSPKSAAGAAKILERYHTTLTGLLSKNSADLADSTGDKEARKRSESKALDASKEVVQQLAALAMPRRALYQISAVVDTAQQAFEMKQDVTDAQTLLKKVAIELDHFSHVIAAWDPTGELGALRSSGDVAAETGLYLKVAWDLQSVYDAENSAKYAQGLILTHIDAIERERHTLLAQIQQAQPNP